MNDFRRNPQQFIDIAAEAINRAKRSALVDGIKYQRLGEEEYYAQELFETVELSGYLKNMLTERTERCVTEQILYDSETEAEFARQLENNLAVKVYAKLPGWFKVPTPLGPYNPDWAVLVEKDNAERLYFVVETKSSLYGDDLRLSETDKLRCGREHFKALARDGLRAEFVKANEVVDILLHEPGAAV